MDPTDGCMRDMSDAAAKESHDPAKQSDEAREMNDELTGEAKGLGVVGTIGRFKPLHLGGELMLEALCAHADRVIIGIGSANKYNARNPFTPAESEGMVRAVLSPRFSNFEVIHVPDFAHIPQYADGQKWRSYVKEHFGSLDYFVTSNDFVAGLLADDYTVIHPASLIPIERQMILRASEVRLEMARGGPWQSLVPKPVSRYLESRGLVDRFRREFGLRTLSYLTDSVDYTLDESAEEEHRHAVEK